MAETPPIRKFMFDHSFDGSAAANRVVERKPVTLKPDQYDALKKECYDSGFAAGHQEGADQQTAALMGIAALIEQRLEALHANIGKLNEERDGALRQMVLSIAKKILPDFTAKNGLQEIQALLTSVISEMVHEPRIVVRVNETQFDPINKKINEITVQKAYAGKVVVLADAEIAASDCRVEWADGGIERSTQATWKDIEQAVMPETQQKPTDGAENG